MAEMPDRWLAAVIVILMVGLAVLASTQPQRVLLFVFVFSLQIGLALYITKPAAGSAVGTSWPNSLALPLASLTALGPLVAAWRQRFTWGGGMAVCTGLLLLTTAVSAVGSPERWIGLAHVVAFLAYYTIFLAAANAVRGRRDLDFARRTLLATLGVQSVIYFVQNLAGATWLATGETIVPSGELLARHGGTVGPRPAVFASFLLPLLLLAVCEFLAARERRGRRRAGLLAAIGSAALVLTSTRASWVAFAAGLAYLLAAGWRRHMLVRQNTAVLLGIVAAVTLALWPRIVTRLSDDHEADLQERWSLVQMAARVIVANPYTGVGAGAYPYAFRDYLTPDLADRWLYVVHNVYVLRAAETGLVGLAAWLLFLAVAFRQASPGAMVDDAAGRVALAWRAGLIALAWEMLWDVSLGPATNSLMWFLCGLMAGVRKQEAELPRSGACRSMRFHWRS